MTTPIPATGPAMGRRSVLLTGAAAAVIAGGRFEAAQAAAPPTAAPERRLFSLGVASGEPLPDSVVLWTRLAPLPLEGGGMPPAPVTVRWELAEDEGMRRIVRRGQAVARREWAHSVHVEVAGLLPGRWYWYRFNAQGEASPIGKTRTAPAPGAQVDLLRFAFASCQDYESGHYGAYRQMAQEEHDFVLFLGDYIYEYAARANRVRAHRGGEAVTLDDYRNRYALYRTDPSLQAAHAAAPWLAVPDDHDVENDYADFHSEKRTPPGEFLRRRAAAYRAYYEHMPLRPAMAPQGASLQFYRRRGWGALADLFITDGRQYRSDQACPGPRWGGQVVSLARCKALADPRRSMFGAAQERWLAAGTARSQATWTVFGQQMMLASLVQPTADGEDGAWTDGWDGYAPARQRLVDHVAAARLRNPVFVAGDIHSYWVNDIRGDFRDPRAPTVASEFVCTAISSTGLPQSIIDAGLKLPHIKYADTRFRGYVACTVTPKLWRSDLRVTADVTKPDSPVSTLRSFVVEAGMPGAVPA